MSTEEVIYQGGVSSESDSDSMEPKDVTSVDLGFVDKDTEDVEFSPEELPSKIGGKPVWLDPRAVLTAESVKCGACEGQMILLAQLYCPLPDREADSFHRTIYIFICPKPQCCLKNSSSNFAVYRCQLPKNNSIYADEDASAEVKRKYLNHYETILPKMCAVCGIIAPYQCSKCKNTSYCCRLHQTTHWHIGGHKNDCNKTYNNVADKSVLLTFPELEIFIEPEPATIKENTGKVETDLSEFLKEQTETEDIDDILESQMTVKNDVAFSKFLRRIKRRPSQIIRYELGSENPLWPSSSNRPSDIPKCENCGAKRQFEFQVMPQLLNFLQLDQFPLGSVIDWATLAIFTCSANCPTSEYNTNRCCYLKEYLWKQDYTDDNN